MLVGGTAFSQAILLLAAPALTRIYSPSDFGAYAIFLSLVAIMSMVSTLRYELAIPLPEKKSEATDLVVISIIFAVFSAILISIALILFNDEIQSIFGSAVSPGYVWLLPTAILFVGVFNTLTQWAIRSRDFKKISTSKVLQSSFTISGQFFLSSIGGVALFLGHLLGVIIYCLRISKPSIGRVSYTSLKELFVRYDRFPKFSLPGGFFRVAGLELPPLILASFFSPAAAGLYALTYRVLVSPSSLIGASVGQVFLSRAPDAFRSGCLDILVEKVSTVLIKVGMPFLFLVVFSGEALFSFVFGKSWSVAGTYASWMAPWLFLVFVSSPLTTLTALLEKQKQAMYFHASLLIARLAALFAGFMYGEALFAIILFSIVNAVWRLFFLFYLAVLSKNSAYMLAKVLFRALVVGAALCSPLIISSFVGVEFKLRAFFLSLLAVLVYFYMFLRKGGGINAA